MEKVKRFLASPEGQGFEAHYSDGQDGYQITTYAGNPKLPELIATILRNYFDFKDDSPMAAHTYCEVDYFRKS